jgi:hypothetical protein
VGVTGDGASVVGAADAEADGAADGAAVGASDGASLVVSADGDADGVEDADGPGAAVPPSSVPDDAQPLTAIRLPAAATATIQRLLPSRLVMDSH